MDAKDESNCSQAIRTRRLTTLLTGVMCTTRTNTLILGQSLILTLKTSFSKQNNHTSEESNQLLLDVVTWTAIIWMTDRLPAVGYIFHKSVPCAKMRHPPGIPLNLQCLHCPSLCRHLVNVRYKPVGKQTH